MDVGYIPTHFESLFSMPRTKFQNIPNTIIFTTIVLFELKPRTKKTQKGRLFLPLWCSFLYSVLYTVRTTLKGKEGGAFQKCQREEDRISEGGKEGNLGCGGKLIVNLKWDQIYGETAVERGKKRNVAVALFVWEMRWNEKRLFRYMYAGGREFCAFFGWWWSPFPFL